MFLPRETPQLSPQKRCHQDAQSAFISQGDEDDKCKDIPQRFWRKVNTNTVFGLYPDADSILFLHRGKKYWITPQFAEVLVGRERSFPFVLPCTTEAPSGLPEGAIRLVANQKTRAMPFAGEARHALAK